MELVRPPGSARQLLRDGPEGLVELHRGRQGQALGVHDGGVRDAHGVEAVLHDPLRNPVAVGANGGDARGPEGRSLGRDPRAAPGAGLTGVRSGPKHLAGPGPYVPEGCPVVSSYTVVVTSPAASVRDAIWSAGVHAVRTVRPVASVSVSSRPEASCVVRRAVSTPATRTSVPPVRKVYACCGLLESRVANPVGSGPVTLFGSEPPPE